MTDDGCRDCLDAGLGHIPEDRQRRGLVLDFSLAENIALHDYDHQPASRFGWLYPKRLVEKARRLLQEFDVRGGGPQTLAGGLSGGNQQKVVLAREIDRNPKVLIAAQPTRGLDVGAIEFVHRRLVEERDEGRAVLLISLELEEILSLSDRILVIYEGEIVGEFAPGVTEDELGIAMIGGGQEGGCVTGPDPSPLGPAPNLAKEPPQSGDSESFATRLAIAQKAGGLVVPLLTTVLAFLIGGLVVLATTGKNPLTHVQGDLRRRGLQLVLRGRVLRAADPVHRRSHLVPLEHERLRVARGAEPAADADLLGAARVHRAGGRVRVPLRDVQHRRAGPVPGRLDHGRLGRLLAAPAAGLPAHRRRDRRRRARRRCLGGHRRSAQGAPSAPTR